MKTSVSLHRTHCHDENAKLSELRLFIQNVLKSVDRNDNTKYTINIKAMFACRRVCALHSLITHRKLHN